MATLRANQDSIFEICAVLSEEENLKVTLGEAGKGALMVGACTFLGGLLGGPIGLAIGKCHELYKVPCYYTVIFRWHSFLNYSSMYRKKLQASG